MNSSFDKIHTIKNRRGYNKTANKAFLYRKDDFDLIVLDNFNHIPNKLVINKADE